MRGWNTRVQRWARGLLRPDKIDMPPRPHEDIDGDTQDQLDEIRSTLRLTDGELPRAADIRARSLRQLLDRFPVLQPPVIHGLLRVGETMNVIAPPNVGAADTERGRNRPVASLRRRRQARSDGHGIPQRTTRYGQQA